MTYAKLALLHDEQHYLCSKHSILCTARNSNFYANVETSPVTLTTISEVLHALRS